MRVLDVELTAGRRHIEKNVFGLRCWLDRVRIGIVDYDSTLHMGP